MKKARLLKMKDLPADEEMIRLAKKEKKEKPSHVFYRIPAQYEYGKFIKARVLKGILKVSVYFTEYLRFSGTEPVYNIFIDKEEEDFITYDFLYQKWSSAKIDRLGWPQYATSRKAFCTQETLECIQNYLGKNDNDPYDAVLAYQEDVREKQLLRKHKAITDKWKDRMQQVPSLPKDWERWLYKVGITQHYIFYHYNRKGVKEGYCTWCEKMVPVVSPKHNKNGICRCCGHKIQFKSVKKAYTVTTEESAYLIQRCSEGVVVREFRARIVYPQEYYKTPFRSYIEQRRIIYDNKLNGSEFYFGTYKRRDKDIWIEGKLKAKELFGYIYEEPFYEGKIYGKSIPSLSKKELRYTGLREMLKEIPCISPKHYFESLKKMPYLEQIIKAGLIQFAYELMENPKKLQLEIKKDLGKSLGIDRFRMNRLREHKGGILYLEWLRNEKKQEKMIPDPVIQWFVAYQISPDEFSFISDRMSETQIKNYLERQKTHTDHTVKNLIILWKDYLTMAKRVGLNIDDAIVYRTRNLEKRHDEMVQIVKDKDLALKAGNIAETFPEVDTICRELKEKYEYESKEYRIVAPKGIEDILEEGDALHHCIDKSNNYFERINTRESYILFLRKSENPDTPYYTLEVEPDGTVRQKRTEFNRQHQDIQLAEQFLCSWQKQLQKKLTSKDYELAAKSKQSRERELNELREKKIKINGGQYGGRLLADVLTEDLMEIIHTKKSAA